MFAFPENIVSESFSAIFIDEDLAPVKALIRDVLGEKFVPTKYAVSFGVVATARAVVEIPVYKKDGSRAKRGRKALVDFNHEKGSEKLGVSASWVSDKQAFFSMNSLTLGELPAAIGVLEDTNRPNLMDELDIFVKEIPAAPFEVGEVEESAPFEVGEVEESAPFEVGEVAPWSAHPAPVLPPAHVVTVETMDAGERAANIAAAVEKILSDGGTPALLKPSHFSTSSPLHIAVLDNSLVPVAVANGTVYAVEGVDPVEVNGDALRAARSLLVGLKRVRKAVNLAVHYMGSAEVPNDAATLTPHISLVVGSTVDA